MAELCTEVYESTEGGPQNQNEGLKQILFKLSIDAV